MGGTVDHVVIAGGGTAGWLAACTIAARSAKEVARPIAVTLVEAPDIPTIGVGEGTWPTIRSTLAAIGIAEDEFILACDASFKQGSRFDGWRNGGAGDSYLHPFTAPAGAVHRAAVAAWQAKGANTGHGFADTVTAQTAVCARDLAPRQTGMPAYAGALNYAYHLDAGKLVDLLRRHAVGKLGVTHLSARIDGVERADNDDIAALMLDNGKRLTGDLFIDCTGMRGLLIAGEMGASWIDRSDVLFNDRALASQVATAPESAIASVTVGTAHDAGWIWDIALPTRRGIGCVYSSRFCTDDAALATLCDYVARAVPGAPPPEPRLLRFESGHRDRFWVGNCLAIGLSAGFVEPLEASAIVLIELSLRALMDGFPHDRAEMAIHARRFDSLFRYRWDRIVEFLKLHYVLSDRTGAYWQAHRDSVPADLADMLALWQRNVPGPADFPMVEEIFPAASWQYVLYGMGQAVPDFAGQGPANNDPAHNDPAHNDFADDVHRRARQLAAALPTNRSYLDTLRGDRARVAQVTGSLA
ncbi:tryptophan 7-halogenase [Croceicoccus ponticola]|uniref:Tryptophan 7-halogenase n=1 Tax=Croceicoccus ponticola TaxID=2217664 RepID=A0A437H1E5_9SPHN|nr:tryptophan halogenase family protein [Croceicoccus ponticola]RVQ69342.1 tryptophan 7-halogenase [Croceicoccus ponticola]